MHNEVNRKRSDLNEAEKVKQESTSRDRVMHVKCINMCPVWFKFMETDSFR